MCAMTMSVRFCLSNDLIAFKVDIISTTNCIVGDGRGHVKISLQNVMQCEVISFYYKT